MTELEELLIKEKIRELKGVYCVYLDLGRWEEYTDLFTEDLVVDLSDVIPSGKGETLTHGRDIFIQQTKYFVGEASRSHQVHPGIINVISPTEATAIWPMNDMAFFPEGAASPSGIKYQLSYGFYHENYRCEQGKWRISRLRLQRLKMAD